MFRRLALIAIAAAMVTGALASPVDAGLLGPLFTTKPQPSLVFAYHGWRDDRRILRCEAWVWPKGQAH